MPAVQAPTPCDLVVLAVLADRPAHGYDVWKRLAENDVADWAPVSRPQVYYSIKKLAGSGLVAPVESVGDAKGPDRAAYAVTCDGRAALKKELARPDWAEQRPPPPFTTWTALSLALPKSARRKQIARRRAFLESERGRETATLEDLRRFDADTARLARAMVAHAIREFELELAWLDELEALIAS